MTDELAVCTVLVRDQRPFRTMVLERLAEAARGLEHTATTAANRQRSDGVLKCHEEYIERRFAELHACEELPGQIGRRDR